MSNTRYSVEPIYGIQPGMFFVIDRTDNSQVGGYYLFKDEADNEAKWLNTVDSLNHE
jgi:hypothetical protein